MKGNAPKARLERINKVYWVITAILGLYFFLVYVGQILWIRLPEHAMLSVVGVLGVFLVPAWILFPVWLIATPVIVVKNFKNRWAKIYLVVLCCTLLPGIMLFGVYVFALTAPMRANKPRSGLEKFAKVSTSIEDSKSKAILIKPLEFITHDTIKTTKGNKIYFLPATAWLEKVARLTPDNEVSDPLEFDPYMVRLVVTFDVTSNSERYSQYDSCVFNFSNRNYDSKVCREDDNGRLWIEMKKAEVADTIWLYGEGRQNVLIKSNN